MRVRIPPRAPRESGRGSERLSVADEGVRSEIREEGEIARVVEVTVDPARVAAAFDRAFRALGRQVRVRGFRPGRAPRSVLQKLYGAGVAEDVERALVGDTLGAVLEQAGLEPVSEPAVEAEPPQEGGAFSYRVRVEVKPRIELGELSGLGARRPPPDVEEAEVERELESLRQRHASLPEEPEETPAAPGHLLTVDFEGRIDGRPFEGGTGRGVTLELGAGQLIPGFDEQLTGARAGQQRTVRVRFPADYAHSELTGKDAEFDVHVVAVRRRELPALDDEFAKDLGDFETLDALRARVREHLEATREREVRAALRRSVLDSLIERAPFPVPPGLVEQRLHRRLHSARHELEERGVPPQTLEAQLARWEEEWRRLAEREVREEWLLAEVARLQELAVTDAELDAKVSELAAAREEDPRKLRKTYREAGVYDALRRQLLEDKAVEFLLREATVETIAGPQGP